MSTISTIHCLLVCLSIVHVSPQNYNWHPNEDRSSNKAASSQHMPMQQQQQQRQVAHVLMESVRQREEQQREARNDHSGQGNGQKFAQNPQNTLGRYQSASAPWSQRTVVSYVRANSNNGQSGQQNNNNGQRVQQNMNNGQWGMQHSNNGQRVQQNMGQWGMQHSNNGQRVQQNSNNGQWGQQNSNNGQNGQRNPGIQQNSNGNWQRHQNAGVHPRVDNFQRVPVTQRINTQFDDIAPLLVKPLPQVRPVPTTTTTRPAPTTTSPSGVWPLPTPAATPVDELDEDEVPFDDYWLEDDLKAKEVLEAARPVVNEIEEVKVVAQSGPSRCVWAIISCCKPAAVTADIRYNCFETIGCHGAFWDINPCSKSMMAAALQATASFYKIPPTESDN